MKQINLTQDLSIGCIVHFRCGGKAKVSKLAHNNTTFQLDDNTLVDYYREKDGRYLYNIVSPFDIVKIDPPPFDWADVKPGMAFHNTVNTHFTYWYVGPALRAQSSNHVVCEVETTRGQLPSVCTVHKDYLIRQPENDIKL